MKAIKMILFLVGLSNFVLAQPGGGGGLKIGSIYDTNGTLISKTNENLQISALLLEDSTLESSILGQLEATYIFRKKTSNLSWEVHCTLPPGNIRLYITYQKDTMLLDLIGIIDENGAGNIDFMDSIVIQPGYFRYRRDVIGKLPKEATGSDRQHRLHLINNGLTLSSLESLIKAGLLKFRTF